tara:strand:- start:417 stop:641 length:225 start_codon:yes stop_codon:yes gene_type:complete
VSKIETFQQRQKADSIYNTYFNEDAEHLLDFNLFDTLNFYGALSKDDFNLLTEKFEKIGEDLYKQIEKFDKENL